MSNTDIHSTYLFGKQPTIEIKGDYIYTFTETDVIGMKIDELVYMIIQHGTIVEES